MVWPVSGPCSCNLLGKEMEKENKKPQELLIGGHAKGSGYTTES